MHLLHKISLQMAVTLTWLLFSFQMVAAQDLRFGEVDPVLLANSAIEVSKTANNSISGIHPSEVAILDYIFHRADEDINTIVASAKASGYSYFDLFEAYLALENSNRLDFEGSSEITILKDATKSQDWHRAFLANINLSVLYLKNRDLGKGHNHAKIAFDVIPLDASSAKTSFARFEALELLHNVFTLDKNLSAMLSATDQLVDIARSTDRRIDAYAIIHNMAFLHMDEKNFDVALTLSNILLNSDDWLAEQNALTTNSLHGNILAKMGNHKDAIRYLETASALSKGSYLQDPIMIALSDSYLASGDTAKARDIFDKIKAKSRDGNNIRQKDLVLLTNLEAKLAYASGEFEKAYRLKNSWANNRIDSLTDSITSDRRRMNADLALSEQLTSQKYESQLIQAELQSQITQRNLAFLGSTVVFLAAIAVFLLLNSRRLKRINHELDESRAEALKGAKAKSDFLAVMSHEVRTPLNSIIPLADLLKNRVKEPGDRSLLSLIHNSGVQLFSIVENILILSQGLDGLHNTPTVVTPREILHDAIKPLHEELRDSGLKVTADISANAPEKFKVDHLKVSKILGSLISNAMKFNSDHGSIHLSCETSRDDSQEYLIYKVADTGKGFDIDRLDEMKEAFKQADMSFTREKDGAGIGLAVADLYAQAVGADLIFDSVIGKGTTVTLKIPLERFETVQTNLAA